MAKANSGNAIHPLYGSIAFGQEVSEKIHNTGADGGKFSFGRTPVTGEFDGVADKISVHQYDDGLKLYVSSIGTNTAGKTPVQDATGMDYSYDNTDDEGIQWSLANAVNKEHVTSGPGIEVYTVGSDAFYCSLLLNVADASGTDDMHFGFRKVQAPVVIDTYTDVASLGVITAADPMLLQTCTALNNASMSENTTSDTVADGTNVKLAVYVSSAGVVTYKIDDAAPTATTAFTFDSGDLVTPFFSYLNGSGVAGAVILKEFEHGRQ